MSLLAKSRKEGQIQHITPQSAGWRYIGFDVWMLKKGQTVTLESGDRELRDAVMGLDDIYRMPILLFYVEGFSIKEISRILQIPEGTVKSRLFAGRGKLREVLGEEVPV